MNRLAKKHGTNDARIFFADNGRDAATDALKPGQLGADEALINAMGIDAVAGMFGLIQGGTTRFSEACADYNAAFEQQLREMLEPVYPGQHRSAIARAKKVLEAAGFPWSVTTGRYHPFINQQVTSNGVRVTRIGCSSTIALHYRGDFFGSYRDNNRDTARWVEALAIATLREAGLPFDDRGWLKCAG